jgi:cyclophilin family peptidyl-prolyl cis-trans isomerase
LANKRGNQPRSTGRGPRPQEEVPQIHEAPPVEHPPLVQRLALPAVFVPVAIGAGALLFLVAFLIRDTDDTEPGIQPPAGETPAATSSPAGTTTPDPRIFSSAEDAIDEENFDYRASIVTESGTIQIDLFEDLAPNTVNSFVFLVNNGYFDGLKWHRVVENFVAQAGDPRSAEGGDPMGIDGPGYETADEPNDLSNTRGRISMAKRAGATTFGSQFFINLKDNPALDDANSEGDAFYPFAEVTEGMDVVDQVAQDEVIQRIEIEAIPKEPADDEPEEGDGE